MKYVHKFTNAKDALNFKRHVLAKPDPDPHKYIMNIDGKLRVFTSKTEADPIIFEYTEDGSNESLIAKALITNKLLGSSYDYDNDVVISKSDLSNVTSLGSAFSSSIKNKELIPNDINVTDLYMLEEFDGITDITGSEGSTYKNLFGCINLERVAIPKNVSEIGVSAFAFCINLKQVKIHAKVKTIKTKAFFNCVSLTDIIIPESVSIIENKAFSKCNNLITIKFMSDTPCKLYKDSLSDISKDCVIYVPKKALSAYKEQWKNISNDIVGF